MSIIVPTIALAFIAAGFTLAPRATAHARCGQEHERGTRCTYQTCPTCAKRHQLGDCDGRRPLPARWYA